jgi:membrane protein required for colicin V production
MVIDIVCLIVALYGLWVGYSRGIIKTVAMVLSILLGVVAAAKFGPAMTEILRGFFPSGGALLLLLGTLLTFLLTIAIIRFIAGAFENMLETININFINQALGGLASAVFFVFIYSVLLSFASRSGMIEEETKEQSMTYELLEPFPDKVWQAGKKAWPIFEEFYDYTLKIMDQFKDDVERSESDRVFNIDDEENDEGGRSSRPY